MGVKANGPCPSGWRRMWAGVQVGMGLGIARPHTHSAQIGRVQALRTACQPTPSLSYSPLAALGGYLVRLSLACTECVQLAGSMLQIGRQPLDGRLELLVLTLQVVGAGLGWPVVSRPLVAACMGGTTRGQRNGVGGRHAAINGCALC